MRVILVDINWTGHHTPYIKYISQYLLDEGHEVEFITDQANPRLDDLPRDNSLTQTRIDFSDYKDDPQAEFKTQVGSGLSGSLREQWRRTQQLELIFERAMESHPEVMHFLYYERSQVPIELDTLFLSCDIPPIVVTLHRDGFTKTNYHSLADRCTTYATRTAVNSSLSRKSISCITVHADPIRDRIISTIPTANLTNVKTIPAPTRPCNKDVNTETARSTLDLPLDIPVLVFFGELRHEKGPDRLIESLEAVEQPLVVVFAGPEYDYTSADVDRWAQRVGDSVRIINRVEYIPEDMVDYYFLAADALIAPYRRTRGISGPMRRAAMAGTPTIGPRDSDVGQLIEQYEVGLTYKAGGLTECIEHWLRHGMDVSTADTLDYGHSRHWRETGRVLEEIYELSINH